MIYEVVEVRTPASKPVSPLFNKRHSAKKLAA